MWVVGYDQRISGRVWKYAFEDKSADDITYASTPYNTSKSTEPAKEYEIPDKENLGENGSWTKWLTTSTQDEIYSKGNPYHQPHER